MDERYAHYEPHVRKAWASVHFELTRVAKEKRVLRKRSPQTKKFDEDDITFYPKPRGRAPAGKSWDPIYGEWTDTSPNKVKKKTNNTNNKMQKNQTSAPLQPKHQSPNHSGNNKTNKKVQPKGKGPKTFNKETKRQTRSSTKQPKSSAISTGPLDTLQRQSARNAIHMETVTTTRVQMPSPKRLERTLEENVGGLLACEATPPSPVKRNNITSSQATSPNKPLMIQKGDALATMWDVPKTKSPVKNTADLKQKRRSSDSNVPHKPWENVSGGLLAEISNTRKRNTSHRTNENEKRLAKRPRLTKLVSSKQPKGGSKMTNSDVIRESKRPLVQREDGTFARPPGKSPQGFSWDEQGGAWVAKGKETTISKSRSQKSADQKALATLTDLRKQTQKKSKDSSRRLGPPAELPKLEKAKSSASQTTEKQLASLLRRDPSKQTQTRAKTTTNSTLNAPNEDKTESLRGTPKQASSRTKQPTKVSNDKISNRVSHAKPSALETKRLEKRVGSRTDETSQLSPWSSPNGSKEDDRSQDARRTRVDNTPEKGTQRRIVPTDSLYSPTNSEPTMQHNAKAASRTSPQTDYGWDDDKGDSVHFHDSPPEKLVSRKRKEPERGNRPLQSALKQPRLKDATISSSGNRLGRSPRFDAAISMLTSTSYHSSPRKGFRTSGDTPDGSRGSSRSPSRNQPSFATERSRNNSRHGRQSLHFQAHAPMNTTMPTESRDYVACGDCLNCRLPINCGACLLCKNSLHFGSLFPSCVRRICVSPVLPPLQRVSMVHFSPTKRPAAARRSPATPIGSPPRRSPKKLAGSESGLLGSFGKYRDQKDEDSMDDSEPAPSKASVQTDDITDVVESLHPDSDDDISDF